MVYNAVLQHGWSWIWIPVMLVDARKYVGQKGSAAMLTSIQSVGVAPEVNLRITEVSRAHKGSTLALKSRADIIRSSKWGYQWVTTKRTCVLQICFSKKPNDTNEAGTAWPLTGPWYLHCHHCDKFVTPPDVTLFTTTSLHTARHLYLYCLPHFFKLF